jgi:hypothetical protein
LIGEAAFKSCDFIINHALLTTDPVDALHLDQVGALHRDPVDALHRNPVGALHPDPVDALHLDQPTKLEMARIEKVIKRVKTKQNRSGKIKEEATADTFFHLKTM